MTANTPPPTPPPPNLSGPAAPRLAILVALKVEEQALHRALKVLPKEARGEVAILRGGVGPAGVGRAGPLITAMPTLTTLCSAGFSGALQEGLAPGTLILGSKIIEPTEEPKTAQPSSSGLLPKEVALGRLAELLVSSALSFRQGTLLAAASPVGQGERKAALGRRTGALGVDMESGEAARLAAKLGLAFFAFRAISDGVDEDLPEEAGGFLDEKGEVRKKRVAGFLLSKPGAISKLWGLGQNASRASRALTDGWKVLLPMALALAKENQRP